MNDYSWSFKLQRSTPGSKTKGDDSFVRFHLGKSSRSFFIFSLILQIKASVRWVLRRKKNQQAKINWITTMTMLGSFGRHAMRGNKKIIKVTFRASNSKMVALALSILSLTRNSQQRFECGSREQRWPTISISIYL